jgi:RND family efflux transporter MFP subunit
MSQAIEPQTAQGPKVKRGRFGLIAALLLGLGLAGIVGVRVKEKVTERAAMQSAHAAAAKEAEAESAKKGEGGPKRATGRAVKGEPLTFKPAIPVTGTLAPAQEADIAFKAPGRLQTIRVKVGDKVKKGALLATLDAAEASAQVAAAAAGVRAAEVAHEMAKDAQRRIDSLFQANAVSEAEKTSLTQRTAMAEAQLAQAKAQASLASASAGNMRIIAPFAGYVTRAPSGVGRFVGPGEPLVHIDDTSVLKLNATLSEADAAMVEVGDTFTIEETSGGELARGGDAVKAPAGKITAVLGSLDPQTRRVPIVGEITNDAKAGLRAGAFVRARITPSREIAALKLPGSALRPGSQDEVVVVKDGRARVVRAVFAPSGDGSLLVRAGLFPADEVLLDPTGEMRDGDLIVVTGGDVAPAALKP